MDNQFVPNLTVGPLVVKALRNKTKKFLDVHMMVIQPEKLVEPFARAGADSITFHIEAAEPRFTFPPKIIINTIKKNNLRCGIAIKPKTPFKVVEKYLSFIDYIVIMSVEPGFGGQSFIPSTLEKIASIDATLKEKNMRDKIAIQVDGGIKMHNAKEVIDAGTDILVAGSEVFKSDNPIETINKMYNL